MSACYLYNIIIIMCVSLYVLYVYIEYYQGIMMACSIEVLTIYKTLYTYTYAYWVNVFFLFSFS